MCCIGASALGKNKELTFVGRYDKIEFGGKHGRNNYDSKTKACSL